VYGAAGATFIRNARKKRRRIPNPLVPTASWKKVKNRTLPTTGVAKRPKNYRKRRHNYLMQKRQQTG